MIAWNSYYIVYYFQSKSSELDYRVAILMFCCGDQTIANGVKESINEQFLLPCGSLDANGVGLRGSSFT